MIAVSIGFFFTSFLKLRFFVYSPPNTTVKIPVTVTFVTALITATTICCYNWNNRTQCPFFAQYHSHATYSKLILVQNYTYPTTLIYLCIYFIEW